MNNVSRSTNKNRWTNSDLSSLTLWVNEGVPIDEIAKRLKKPTDSVANVLNTKRGILKPKPNVLFERKSANNLIHHNISYLDNIIFITTIIQLNENYFQARAFLSDTKLSDSMGVLVNEFTSTDACARWFDTLPDTYASRIN